jgi:hypothetical protein
MKATTLRFLSPSENAQPKKSKPQKVVFTGYISGAGKLVFPDKTTAGLDVDLSDAAFKIGVQEGKTKATSIYMVPATDDDQDTFSLQRAAKGYTLLLAGILKNIGVDYVKNKQRFVIRTVDLNGIDALELQLQVKETGEPKAPYTGKPRGRKPAGEAAAA